VRFVEHMRNVEGVSDVSVHAMSPVPLAFRAYYKVEVPADGEPAAEAAHAEPRHAETPEVPEQAEPAEVAEPAMDVVPELQPVMAEAGVVEPEPSSNGKRSLGFFAH
jgi:hypothetical protein